MGGFKGWSRHFLGQPSSFCQPSNNTFSTGPFTSWFRAIHHVGQRHFYGFWSICLESLGSIVHTCWCTLSSELIKQLCDFVGIYFCLVVDGVYFVIFRCFKFISIYLLYFSQKGILQWYHNMFLANCGHRNKWFHPSLVVLYFIGAYTEVKVVTLTLFLTLR